MKQGLMRGFYAVLWLMCVPSVWASTLGNITHYQGSVKVYAKDAVRGKTVTQADYPLVAGDLVKTGRQALCVIVLADGSKMVLKGGTKLTIQAANRVHAESGRTVISFKKQSSLKGLEVATKSAIIGVKGTRFVVDYQQDQVNVFLRNGQLDVRSLSGQFKRYRQKQRAEFDTFRQQMMGGFKQYKQQLHEEFVEYVEQFNMASGSAISIGNNEVRDLKIPVDIQAEFDWIDRF